jgi:hypothetical protein
MKPIVQFDRSSRRDRISRCARPVIERLEVRQVPSKVLLMDLQGR